MNIKMTDKTMKLNLANRYSKEDIIVSIPDDYIKPENTIEITENGIVDVTQYASAKVDVLMPSLEGTVVPIGVPVDKIYFNSNLSKEETVNYLKELTYIQTGLFENPVYCPFISDVNGDFDLNDVLFVLIEKKDENKYNISMNYMNFSRNEIGGITIFDSSAFGWNSREFAIGVGGSVASLDIDNRPSLSDFQGLPIGLENEKIKNVISMTPFVTEGIYPVGELEITENGVVDVSQYASASVSVASSGSGGGGEVGDGYKIRYIDVDGTVLKTEYVPSGGKLTPPSNPTYDSEYLEFNTWNYDIDNYIVNGNTDVGAIYRTITGDSYLFIRLTENIGLTIPKMNISGATSIDWGDGTVDTNLTHTYADYGDYVIKISGMTQITNYLFGSSGSLYNYSLLKCYLGSTVTSIGNNAISSCDSITSVVIPESVTSIGNYAISSCRSLTSVVIPESVTSIGNYAFNNCFSLTSVVIPESVTSIENKTFYYCYSLTSVVIPENVTSIGNEVFSYCYSLTSVVIPESVTSVGDSAFSYCHSITSVIIPENVTSIGSSAFSSCRSIKHYVLECSSVPTLSNTNAFSNINKVATIWVKDELVEEYKSATNWSTYATYIKPISAMPQKLKEELGVL